MNNTIKAGYDNVNAEIVAIGTELLLGELTDTNSVYLARCLRDLGINLFFKTAVGDNAGRIASALRIALSRADVVITCGGLGPTVDDMTRQSVAAATDRELVFHQTLLDQIAARFATFRVAMTENNRQQAYLPVQAQVIENPVGTAPAFMVEHQGKLIISLPGVPREMKFLMQQAVIPYLRQRYHLGIIKARNIKVAGIGESALDELIGKDLLEGSNPSIGLAAHHGVIDVRVTAKGQDETSVDALIATCEAQLMERIGGYVFGHDDDTLESVLTDLLTRQQGKVAVLEAGISDAVISKLTHTIEGERVLAGMYRYAQPAEAFAGWPECPATSLRDFAIAAAERIAQQHGAAAGIAIVSLPDVDENADKTEATAVAVYTGGKSQSRVYGFGGKSEMARAWGSRWAMAWVWRMLKETYGLV